ncbi:MAG: hypothetical protein NTW96_09940 [Planctomycetia bacterium]|nr:hypothetical protein [Planctomycetia bacterium]
MLRPTILSACRVAMLVWLAVCAGCAKLDLADDFTWLGIEEKPRIPNRMVCMWTDAMRHKLGEPSDRGFGGRIMFYAKSEKDPVLVDGTLSVYVFQDNGEDPKNTVPEKKFVFLAEQLPLHHSKSDLGHSYSFYLPWDKVGGPERQLNLIVRFEATTGQVVMSDASRKTLPGQTETAVAGAATVPGPALGGVQQASHTVVAPGGPSPMGMKVETIDVPPSFGQSGAASAAEASVNATTTAAPTGWQTQVTYPYPQAAQTYPQTAQTPPQTLARLPAAEPSGYSAPRRLRAPRATRDRPMFGRVPTQPLPEASPSGPQPTPTPGQSVPAWVTPPGDPQVATPWPPATGG